MSRAPRTTLDTLERSAEPLAPFAACPVRFAGSELGAAAASRLCVPAAASTGVTFRAGMAQAIWEESQLKRDRSVVQQWVDGVHRASRQVQMMWVRGWAVGLDSPLQFRYLIGCGPWKG